MAMEVPLSDQDEDNEDWISSTALDFLPDSFLSSHQFERLIFQWSPTHKVVQHLFQNQHFMHFSSRMIVTT